MIWGLCDAASAALFFAHREPRVRGLILVNPWARTIGGNAKTYIKHYYTARLLDPSFWRKLVSGRFALGASLRSFGGLLRDANRKTGGASSEASARPAGRRYEPAAARPHGGGSGPV